MQLGNTLTEVTDGRGAQLLAAGLLTASTTAGVAAWFLPAPMQPVVGSVAAATAVAGLAVVNVRVRSVIAMALAALIWFWYIWFGLALWAISGNFRVAAVSALLVVVVAKFVLRFWSYASQPGLGDALSFAYELLRVTRSRRSAVMECLAKLTELAEVHAISIGELRQQNLELQLLVKQLRSDLAEAESWNRRSSLLSFWGGVALSIPIGVAINLVTG